MVSVDVCLVYLLLYYAIVATNALPGISSDGMESSSHKLLPSFLGAPSQVNMLSSTGVALFFLLGFRTNCSYQHWWQGRIEWSMIQARSLNMARECVAYVDDIEMRNSFLKWNAALIVAMKAHLREDRVSKYVFCTEDNCFRKSTLY